MDATVKVLKHKIDNFTPELLKAFVKVVENFENQNKSAIPQFQLDEILYRIQFHKENPKTKLDFFKNISELENNLS